MPDLPPSVRPGWYRHRRWRGTIQGVYFVLLAAAVAILTGVVAVAMGWGGELAASRRDRPEVPVRARTAADVAMLRLPLGPFGYQQEATDAALHAIAGLVARRDAEISDLRDEVRRLRAQLAGAARPGSRAAQDTDGPADAAEAGGPDPVAGQADGGGTQTVAGPLGSPAGEVLSGRAQPAGQPPGPA